VADTEGGNFLDDLKAKAKEVGEQVREFAEDAFDNVKDTFDGDDEKAASASSPTEPTAPPAPAEPVADPSGDGVSVHDAPVTDSVRDAADELADSQHSGPGDDAAAARGSSGEADPSDRPLPGEDSGDLRPATDQVGDSGVNDFGDSERPVESFADTEASALDAPPEGPDAQTSKPLS